MKNHSRKNKIISIALFVFCLFVVICGDYFPLEFTNATFKNIFYTVVYISLPILFVRTLIILFKPKDSQVLIIVAGFFSIPTLLFVGCAHTMCGTTKEPIYQNNASGETIERRSYGCGAWDSDFPVYQFYKIAPATPFFCIVTDVDITKLDRTLWQEYIPNSTSASTPEEKAWEKAALKKAASDKAKTDKDKK